MFPCFICQLPYGCVDDLVKHLLYNHNLKPNDNFICFYCRQSCKPLSNYKTHLTKSHRDHDQEWDRHVGQVQVPINVNNDGNENINLENELDRDVHGLDVGDVPGMGDVPDAGDAPGVGDRRNADADRFSLEYFIDSLYRNVQLYIAQLYAVPNSSRKFVDTIISGTSELIGNSLAILKDNVFRMLASFEDLPDNYADEIVKLENMFSTLINPFEYMKTEHKRLASFIDRGCYIPPISFEMGDEDKYVKTNNGIELVRSPVYGQVIPLRKVLKEFLELPGIFAHIVDYLDELKNSDEISNFVQGDLWSDICKPYENESKFVLPLHIEFDDYEPDNPLGSHHNENGLGALYASIPCLRPEFQSSLDNMFVLSLFNSKSRKTFGNAATFAPSIEELNFLAREGILIKVEGQEVRVYFAMCLIKGDNAGLNGIEGFIDGFRANYYCRICKLHRNEMYNACRPPPVNRLRTVHNYAADLLVNDNSQTGITERCVFNDVDSYHCIVNANCEILHDCYEGALVYGICNVLFYFIEVRGYFDLDLLKERIDGFHYGPNENGNKPPTAHLTVGRLQQCSWNLSGCEMLCLCRNLALMIGDLVPHGNDVWRFYLVLREIVEAVTCPVFQDGVDVYLTNLIQEHHQLFIYYFGNLKPKHHFMVHFPYLLKRNGPLVHLSALMLERNHRRGKLYAKACNSRINFPLTMAIKFQLYLCERLMRTDNLVRFVKTSAVSRIPAAQLENYRMYANQLPFNAEDIVSTAKGTEVYGTMYSVGMVIVYKLDELFPSFAKIVQIVIEGNNVTFILNLLKCEMFLEHVRAYVIEASDLFTSLPQSELIYHSPLWPRTYRPYSVVTLKHML